MSTYRRFAIATLTVAVLLTGLAGSVQAEGNAIEVAPGESIQSALLHAEEGATVHLLPGIHRENLRIESGVSLVGDPDQPETVILEALMAGPVIMISGSDAEQEVMIEGMTIRGASGYLPDGILYFAAASVHFSALIIENCQANGITVAGNGAVLVTDCRISTNGRFGIDVQNEMAIVEGHGNEVCGNGADLGGYAPPILRMPLAPQTSSQTIRVPEQYVSLQEAVDAAPEGASILVSGGEFKTGLTIWKDVSIIGQEQAETTLIPTGSEMVALSILATARSVSLQHLTLMATEQRPIAVFGKLGLEDVAVIGQRTINQDPIFRINAGGTLEAHNSCFEQIGGVAVQTLPGSLVTIVDCKFSENHRDIAIEGASNVTITSSQFANTRERAVSIFDSTFLVKDCTFEACMDSLEIAGSMGTIHNVKSAGAARNGIWLYDGANASLEACTLTESGNYNLLITGDAIATLSHCTLSQATYVGLAAMDTAGFTMVDSSLSENRGAGLIIAGQARGEISSSLIQGNGDKPTLSSARNELPGGGIVASMNSHLILISVDILRNSQGVLIDPVDPFYDDMISLYAHREIVSFTPIVEMHDCRLEGNSTTGIRARSACELRMVDCSISANAELGIWLDGTAYVLTNESRESANLVYQDVEGIEVFLSGCEVANNVWVGVWLDGLAAAEIVDSDIFANGGGIGMEVTARLSLEGNRIFGNVGCGVLFSSEDYQISDPYCVPEVGRLTGFGNTIPEPWEENGNGAGAFTAGSFPCLTLPEGCEQED